MVSSVLTITILFAIIAHCPINCDFSQRQVEKKLIEELTSPSKYDKDIRPGMDGPVTVTMNMFIRDIYNFHPGTQTMNVQITFRQQWLDERLKFDDKPGVNTTIKSLNVPGSGSLIWTPDVFFSNEREGRTHDLLRPNIQLRVLSSGVVLYSRRITIKVTCSMCLKHYPFDNQNCSMKMASYGMTSSDLIFKWKDSQSVNVNKNLVLRNFKFINVTQEECVGEFTCLRAIFRFERILWPQLSQLFIPSILIHSLSYIPFWFKSRNDYSRIIRVFISFFSFLFVTWFCVTSEITRSPDAFEFNAKDIWVFGVSIITFISFVHVCVIEIMSASLYAKYRTPKLFDTSDDVGSDHSKAHFKAKVIRRMSTLKPVNVSYLSCAIYPLIFITFNAIYWTYCLELMNDF